MSVTEQELQAWVNSPAGMAYRDYLKTQLISLERRWSRGGSVGEATAMNRLQGQAMLLNNQLDFMKDPLGMSREINRRTSHVG